MAYCVFRFHHKEGRQADYNPENKKLEWWLTIGTGRRGAMLAPGLVVWHQFVTVPADATGSKSWASNGTGASASGEDGRMGTTDVRHVSADNPMGLNPDDKHGQDDVVIASDDLHLPVGKPVKVCSAPSMSCTISMCPSSAPRWTWSRAWSPISG